MAFAVVYAHQMLKDISSSRAKQRAGNWFISRTHPAEIAGENSSHGIGRSRDPELVSFIVIEWPICNQVPIVGIGIGRSHSRNWIIGQHRHQFFSPIYQEVSEYIVSIWGRGPFV